MKTDLPIVVLSGESGCGKTTLCARVIAQARARSLVVAGILTPARSANGCRVGLDVEDIRTGQRRPLAEARAEPYRNTTVPPDSPVTESWRFHAGGLAWGTMVLRRATPCDLLVIDELGPLELLRNQGWMIGFDLLRTGRYRLALVTVRPALLARFREWSGSVEIPTLVVTRANQDALAGQIIALLRGER